MPVDAGPGLPLDWQERMVEMIRGATELDDTWFAGGPVCSPLDQIAIYRRQYALRLFDALVEEVPGLCHLLGDAAGPVLRAYLMEHPSASWTLNRVADRLPGWLEARGDQPPEVVEMAWLDRCVQAGFEAGQGVALDPAELATMPPLQLQPHVSLLRLSRSVHLVRSAVLSGADDGPELVQGDYPLVVFRRGLKMRHWVMPLGAWGVLDAIDGGASVPEALDRVFARGWVNTETLADDVGQWFRDFAERGLVMRRGDPLQR